MKRALYTLLFTGAIAMSLTAANNVYDFTMNSIDGQPVALSEFKGKVVLIVNVASRCGFTPQYEALEKVYETYKGKDFVIVGVPANNFGGQEPGTNDEIKTFCTRKYNVSFPMMAKVSVKGDDMAPLYRYLTQAKGGDVKWNFTKFLIGKDGQILQRFESPVKPDAPEVIAAIEAALK